MLQDHEIPNPCLEDLPLFGNILRSGITKVSTWLELFPCVEVIAWIFSKVNAMDMILYNVEDKGCAYFIPSFIDKVYNLPVLEVNMTKNWITC